MTTPAPVTPPPAHDSATSEDAQYGRARILGVWAAAALPMGTITWVITPLLIRSSDVDPGLLHLVLITLGLVWQGVLSLLLLRREVRSFTRANLARRLWLNAPLHPRTGAPSWRLLGVAVAVAVVLLGWDTVAPLDPLDELWVRALPWLAPPDWALITNLAGPAEGRWWLLGVLVVLIAFNYLLGEELIFRGVLLPRMRGAFGRWDWVVNGVLFSTYHLHLIWQLPSQIILRDWVYALVAKRYRSFWMAALLHGLDALWLVVLFPLAILGRL